MCFKVIFNTKIFNPNFKLKYHITGTERGFSYYLSYTVDIAILFGKNPPYYAILPYYILLEVVLKEQTKNA
jgi:hypothetical protein